MATSQPPMQVTGTGIAVALAVAVAFGLLFFGSRVSGLFNNKQSAATTTTTAMQASNTPTNPNTNAPAAGSDTGAAGVPTNIPANLTQLMTKDITVGTGAEAKPGSTVTVQYVGMLTNGQIFDASKNHGDAGFTFNLGAGQVIKGWDEGVVGMKVGGTRELVIPASLGYGAQAVGPIPANSTLVFKVQLLNVK